MNATHYPGSMHLECSRTQETFPSEVLQNLSPAGAPLLARYDLAALAKTWKRDDLALRPQTLWRYAEVLPVRSREAIVSLGELMTPLIHTPRLAQVLAPGAEIYVKDESSQPTSSFKARGMALAVSRAKELGAPALALPTAGNAGSAAAAYGAAAKLPVHVIMPEHTPKPIVTECRALGAQVELFPGLIHECAVKVREGSKTFGWFDLSTLREPYRLEGKKTMGYELAEQFGWELPDVIVYPTGGGTGLIGMWKAFDEMEALGWIGAARPRMVSVQATGCAPIVKAYLDGQEHAQVWLGASTYASGLCVPKAIGDFLILRAIRASGGTALAISDEEMREATTLVGKTTGIFVCPEGAATAAAVPKLVRLGFISPGERVVLFNTASGLKYID
ncbi:MAG: threonine synthase [Oligoflexus sp.]